MTSQNTYYRYLLMKRTRYVHFRNQKMMARVNVLKEINNFIQLTECFKPKN